MKKFITLFILIILIFCTNCIQKEEVVEDLDDVVVAEVGDEKLTRGELNSMLETAKMSTPKMYRHQITPELIMDQWIEQKLIAQEGRKLGYDEDESIVNSVRDYEDKLLMGKVWEKEIEEKTKLSDKEIRDFYDNNKEQYRANNEKVNYSIITVKTVLQAKEIIKKAREGEDFKKLEAKYDIEIDKPQFPKYYSKNELPTQLAEALFNMEVGEISEPIKYAVGFVVLKLNDRIQPGEYIPFDKVKEQIEERALLEKQKEAAKNLVENLKSKTNVVKYLNKYKEAEEKANKLLEEKNKE